MGKNGGEKTKARVAIVHCADCDLGEVNAAGKIAHSTNFYGTI